MDPMTTFLEAMLRREAEPQRDAEELRNRMMQASNQEEDPADYLDALMANMDPERMQGMRDYLAQEDSRFSNRARRAGSMDNLTDEMDDLILERTRGMR